MTQRQEKLIENYVRTKVRTMLKEGNKNRLTEGVMAEFAVKSERTYDAANPDKYDEVTVSLYIHGNPLHLKRLR